MPIYTEEQKRRILEYHGYDPKNYVFDSDTQSVIPRSAPSSQPGDEMSSATELSGANIKEPPSMLESMRRAATEETLPFLGGVGSWAAGAALAPETGALSLAIPLAASIAGSMGTSALQNRLIPESLANKLFTRPEDIEAHPIATSLARFIPGAIAARPGISETADLGKGLLNLAEVGRTALTPRQTATLLNAAMNVAPAAGFEAYDVLSGNKEFNPLESALNILPGAFLNKPTAIGRLLGFHTPETAPVEPGVRTGTEQPPALPITPEESAQAGGGMLGQLLKSRNILPTNVKGTEAGINKALRARNAMETFKGPEAEAKALEAQQGAMEAEGGIPQDILPSDIKQREYELALREKGRQDLEEQRRAQSELDRQEAAMLASQNAERALRLQNSLKENLVPEQRPPTPKVTELGKELHPDYTGNVEEDIRQNVQAPETEAERIQKEYDLGQRQQETAKLIEQSRQELDKLNQEQRDKLQGYLRAQAKARGFQVQEVPEIKTPEGKSIAGDINLKNRLIRISQAKAGAETVPHEGAHGFINDLLNSTNPKDQNLALRGLEYASGQKFSNVDAWRQFETENMAEARAAEEKWVGNSLDLETLNQTRRGLYGTRREKFMQWAQNVKAHLANKLGIANPEDITAHTVARYRKDVPFREVGGLAGRITPGVGERQQEESKIPKKIEEQLGEASFRAAQEAQTEQRTTNFKNKTAEDYQKASIASLINTEAEKRGIKHLTGENADIIAEGYVAHELRTENYLKNAFGEEFMGELEAERHNTRQQLKDIRTEGERNVREKVGKANLKAQEVDAFTNPRQDANMPGEFFRHQEEPKLQEESPLKEVQTPQKDEYLKEPGFLDKFFASATQKVRNITGDTAGYVADKLEQHAAERSLHMGKYRNAIQGEVVSYPKDVREKVDQYGREMMEYGKSNVVLNPEEQSLYDHIHEYLVKVADENTGLREIQKDPNYWPQILNSRVAYVWSKNPNSPESKRYKREWLEHAQENPGSYTPEELKNILDEYVNAIGGKEPSLTFGALRKAAGLGLPESMQDNNLLSRFSRYGRRVAVDRAYQGLENDPVMRYTMRIPDKNGKIQTEVPKLPNGQPVEDLRGSEPIQESKKFINQEFSSLDFPRLYATSKAITSAVLGTGTGIRNLVQAPNNLLAVIGPRNAKELVGGIKYLTTAWDDSFRYNARQIRMNELEFGSAASPDMWTRTFNNLSDIFRKYSGRELSEQFERAYEFAVGKATALAEIRRAGDGDTTAQSFLKKHGNTVEGGIEKYFEKNGADIPEDVLNRVAKSVVDSAAGTYDERGLPTIAMEGPLAPFLAISRWSIEKGNRVYHDLIIPAKNGNPLPLLTYALSSVMTGAAIKKLNEMMSGGKRSPEPSIQEAAATENIPQEIRAVTGLAQLGSFAGMAGDIMKSAADMLNGHLRLPINYPMADFVQQTIGENLTDYFGALESGEKPLDATTAFIQAVMTQSVQSARLASYLTWNHDDVERKNEYRDVRLWQELTHRATPESVIQRPNEMVNVPEKKFKQAKDIGEAVEALPEAIGGAMEKSGDFLEFKRRMEGLRRNENQTVPKEPAEQMMYLRYLADTQGEDAAVERLISYLRQQGVNKLKSQMVPKL